MKANTQLNTSQELNNNIKNWQENGDVWSGFSLSKITVISEIFARTFIFAKLRMHSFIYW